MKNKPKKLKTEIPNSKIKLRVCSGILFILGCVSGYLSRRIDPHFAVTRVAMPNEGTYFYYIWQLVLVSILLFASSLTLFIISFKKGKK